MDKRSLNLLEKVFSAEIDSDLSKVPALYQTKSKLAQKLEAAGLLVKVRHVLGGPRFPVVIEGYRLTTLGNLTYCMTCKDESPNIGREVKG